MNLPPLFDEGELEALACAEVRAPEGFTATVQARLALEPPAAGPVGWWKQAAAVLVAASAIAPVLSWHLPSPDQLEGWPSKLAAEAAAALEAALDAAARVSLADFTGADQAVLQAASGLAASWPAGAPPEWIVLAAVLFWIAVHGGVRMSRVPSDRT